MHPLEKQVLFLWFKYYIHVERHLEKFECAFCQYHILKFFYKTQKFISNKNDDTEKFDTLWNRRNQIFS